MSRRGQIGERNVTWQTVAEFGEIKKGHDSGRSLAASDKQVCKAWSQGGSSLG